MGGPVSGVVATACGARPGLDFRGGVSVPPKDGNSP